MAREEKANIHLGLEGVYFTESKICKVDGVKGRLYYRGYAIEDIAKSSDFEEVSYLLLHGNLPNKKDLSNFKRQMAMERELPQDIVSMIKSESSRSHPMHVLLAAIAALASYDAEADISSGKANIEKSIRIISKIGSVVGAIGRFKSNGKYVKPREDLGHAANILYMATGIEPEKERAKLLDLMMVLHAEHSSNASTFSTIVTGSTLSDIYSAIASGIGTLKGPLHGGADEMALKMLREIKSPKNTADYIKSALEGKKRIMGFGHRVYKTYDPRAKIIKKTLLELSRNSNEDVENLSKIALSAEKIMIDRLGKSKGIWPNVDFFSGPIYTHIGIAPELFTPLFAASRSPGWCAHMLEYWDNSRLIRPLEYYTGSINKKYIQMNRR